MFRLRLCSRGLIRLALQFKWNRGSPGRGWQGHYLWSRLNGEGSTIFVGGSEVVLDCLDDVGLDIFLLLEGECGAVDELPFFVLCDIGGSSCFDLTFLHFGGEEGNSLDDASQHMYDIFN